MLSFFRTGKYSCSSSLRVLFAAHLAIFQSLFFPCGACAIASRKAFLLAALRTLPFSAVASCATLRSSASPVFFAFHLRLDAFSTHSVHSGVQNCLSQ